MRNKKGFTLVELLAVIVVLAIIALIATPQILNVVEKARKGAAKSSALGYIDAVEKQIMVNQLNENPEILDGEYSLPMDNKYKISIKGSKPSSGNMTITKSKVVSATMCINNYTVTYNGKTATVGDKCNGSSSNTESGSSNAPTIDTCPGCVYAYTMDVWKYSGTPTTLSSNQYKTDYREVVSASGMNYFLGMKLNSSGVIEKAYACEVNNGKAFCLEGSMDGSLYSENRTLLQSLRSEGVFDKCYDHGDSMTCVAEIEADTTDHGTDYVNYIEASITAWGIVSVNRTVSVGYGTICYVNDSGELYCAINEP